MSEYRLESPLLIAPNLEAGLRMGDDWLTLRPVHRDAEGRLLTTVTVLRKGAGDLHCQGPSSGCWASDDSETLRSLFDSLLVFLCVESDETLRELWPVAVADWAESHADELELALGEFVPVD